MQFTKPADFVFTALNQGGDPALDSDANPGTGQTGQIALESGETDRTWDAGVFEPVAPEIGDFVWDDLNGNGRQDPDEPGIDGVTVNLYDCTGALIATTTTATDSNGKAGQYLFTAPEVAVGGCYQVEFVEPTGYCEGAAFTVEQAEGVDAALDSDAPLSGEVLLTPPDELVNLTVDAGVVCPAALGDYVWEDRNRDGIQNEGPASGVNGVTVELLDPGADGCATGDETVILSTLTGNDASGNPGYYLFSPLDLGVYCVQVIKPEGFRCTVPNVGPSQPSAVDSDVEATPAPIAVCQTKDPVEDPIDLSSGETDTSWDAGIYRPASLGDEVWEDLNGNGVQDDGEPGIAGVSISSPALTARPSRPSPTIRASTCSRTCCPGWPIRHSALRRRGMSTPRRSSKRRRPKATTTPMAPAGWGPIPWPPARRTSASTVGCCAPQRAWATRCGRTSTAMVCRTQASLGSPGW